MDSQTGSRVCAIIVTFNRKSLLDRGLTAVLQQSRVPDKVLVVDNQSTDDTPEYLAAKSREHPAVETLRLPENLGPAGGFEAGIRWAAGKNYDYIWIMDDDDIPEPSCLERLLARMGGREDVTIWPYIHNDVEDRRTTAPGWHAFLIPMSVVKKVGFPRGELFWWIEDTEYLQWRMERKHNVRRIFEDTAVVRHMKQSKQTGGHPAWKYYYEARNTVYYRLYNENRRYKKMAIGIAKITARALLRDSDKLRKLGYVLLGVSHGFRQKLGKIIDPASEHQ